MLAKIEEQYCCSGPKPTDVATFDWTVLLSIHFITPSNSTFIHSNIQFNKHIPNLRSIKRSTEVTEVKKGNLLVEKFFNYYRKVLKISCPNSSCLIKKICNYSVSLANNLDLSPTGWITECEVYIRIQIEKQEINSVPHIGLCIKL